MSSVYLRNFIEIAQRERDGERERERVVSCLPLISEKKSERAIRLAELFF